MIGGTNTANSLSGGIDEVFQRTDSAGARSLLTDALGSTLALTDSMGTVQTQYTFEPFGNTTSSGSGTTNTFGYTGRELDAGNLYFYRARYYSPSLQSFVSEDPLGFAASGPNLYAYANSSPTNLVDPAGTISNVSRSGNTITVSASVTIYGPDANTALAQIWQDTINSVWNNSGNNFSYGNCHVKFNVHVTADPSANYWFTANVTGPAQNYVYVVGDPNFRSTFGSSTFLRFSMFGSFSSGTGGSGFGPDGYDYASHEAGHIFGLGDDYADVDGVSVPLPGHEGHIMASGGSPYGQPVQHEINDILAGRACGCQ